MMTEETVNTPVVDTAPVAAVEASVSTVVSAAAPEVTVVEASPSPAPTTPAKASDTLLAVEPAKDETPAPAEGEKPVEEVAPVDAAPIEAPVYEAFELPEGATVDEAKLKEFTDLVGQYEVLTKADHAETQKFAQSLINKHIEELQKFQTAQVAAWDAMKEQWKQDFVNDPELGGKRVETTIAEANSVIAKASSQTQQDFRKFLVDSGGAYNPAVIRFLAEISRPAPQPLTANAPASNSKPKAHQELT